MLKKIKGIQISKLMKARKPDSHKGENGRVMIIGGSLEYYGAPVLAGLGALYSGADLVYLLVPECNFDCSRSLYPDFFVQKYEGENFNMAAAKELVEFAKKKCDSVVIGPGLGKNEGVIEAVKYVVENLNIPTVLDADAIAVLKDIERFPLNQIIVATPHQNEFRELVDRDVTVGAKDTQSVVLLRSVAMDLHISILLKGHIDFVTSDDGYMELNENGNAGMTVGGSGDVLAGMVGTFLAQGMPGYDAARLAAYFNGEAGDKLKKLKGFNFSASDLALKLAEVVR